MAGALQCRECGSTDLTAGRRRRLRSPDEVGVWICSRCYNIVGIYETDSDRSRVRYTNAPGVVPKITLNYDEADALRDIRRRTGETISALIRRLLREEAAR